MMIFHHYEMSPFSEKVRLLFGYAEVPWQSALVPAMPPRPGLDPLTGGYRRIPVAQIGADLFCDTRVICEEIAALTEKQKVSLYDCSTDEQDYAAQLDGAVFWAAVLSIPQLTVLKQLLRGLGLFGTVRFVIDRAGIGRNARLKAPSAAEATQQFEEHLREMEQRLQSDFLFGDAPTYADFAAYHTLWFHRAIGDLPMPAGLPHVTEWYQRMTAIGHGDREEISQTQVFAAARDNSPRPISGEHTKDAMIGKTVSIKPSDYALDAVTGTLVGSSETRYIVARETQEFGTIHVHFPRMGFEVTQ
jgi:glutathione S-transferase